MDGEFKLTKDHADFIDYMVKKSASQPRLNTKFRPLLMEFLSKAVEKNAPGSVCYHAPSQMIKFLSMFSKDEHFKWYTHKWDQSGLCLEDMISAQSSNKGRLSRMLYNSSTPVNALTYYQIWNFINFNFDSSKNYWTDNHGQQHKEGWHSIVELKRQRPDLPVENLKLSDGHLFKDYIRQFKSSIEFRTDLDENDRFSEFVRATIRKFINGAVSVKYDDGFDDIGYDINIYCDVVAIHFALQIICNWIVTHKDFGPNVKVELLSEEDAYELIIFQEGTYFNNQKKLETPSGDLASLRNRLFSVCDFKMLGDCKINRKSVGSVVVSALYSGTKKDNNNIGPCVLEQSEEAVGGVKYVLKFYRS